jgi:hypothetical protein
LIPEGDSARRLGALTLRLGDSELFIEGSDSGWFSVPNTRRRLVPGRGIFLLPLDEQFCAEIERGARTVEVEIRGPEIEPANSTFELQQPFVAEVVDACRPNAGDEPAQTAGTASS